MKNQDVYSPELNRLHKHRLETVEQALRESKAALNLFDMGLVTHRCGTPSCAFGHYAARTDLQDTYEIKQLRDDSDGEDVSEFFHTCYKGGGPVQYYEQQVLDHFGLTFQEHHELFRGGGCRGATTPTEAADYFRDFINRKYDLASLNEPKPDQSAGGPGPGT